MDDINEPLQEGEVEVAPFSDRMVAFTIDYALFTTGFFLSLKLVFPKYPVLINPHGMQWAWMWIGLFVLYQSFFSSQGRVSVGKHLLGIRVVTLNGEPLSVGQGAVRSLGYLISSILSLGFLWMLGNTAKQTWHDMLVGSVVVRERTPAPVRTKLVQVGAAACLLAFTSLWTWEHVVAETYYRTMTVANAYVGLQELASLQKLHYAMYDKYADNLMPLAVLSGTPNTFMDDMTALFDAETGVDIRVSKTGYVIKALARDEDRTPVKLSGP